MKKRKCNFSALLRELRSRGYSPNDRRHNAIGIMTAQFVMRRKRMKFLAHDVPIKRGVIGKGVGHTSPETIRYWVKNFLSDWERPGPGNSIGSEMILEACPQLTERVRKYWGGF